MIKCRHFSNATNSDECSRLKEYNRIKLVIFCIFPNFFFLLFQLYNFFIGNGILKQNDVLLL